MNLSQIIKKPLITEKSLADTKLNRYTFQVDPRCTKNQIKQAVTQYFKVQVVSIRTQMQKSQSRHTGRKRLLTTKGPTKKAIVQIKSGQTIKAFEVKG